MTRFAAVLFVILASAAIGTTAAERPHVVLIMVDDLGFSDLGYMGGEIRTPHLDSLAAGAARQSGVRIPHRCAAQLSDTSPRFYRSSGVGPAW